MDDLTRLVRDLGDAPATAVRRGRGVSAPHIDRMAAEAKANALARWSRYGRGEAGSAGTIRPRMSRDRSKIIGYLLADGPGAFQAEHGKHDRAPDPVMGPAAEDGSDAWAEGLGDMLEDLL